MSRILWHCTFYYFVVYCVHTLPYLLFLFLFFYYIVALLYVQEMWQAQLWWRDLLGVKLDSLWLVNWFSPPITPSSSTLNQSELWRQIFAPDTTPSHSSHLGTEMYVGFWFLLNTVGWSDFALFAIFEKFLPIRYIFRSFLENRQNRSRARVARAAKFSFF